MVFAAKFNIFSNSTNTNYIAVVTEKHSYNYYVTESNVVKTDVQTYSIERMHRVLDVVAAYCGFLKAILNAEIDIVVIFTRSYYQRSRWNSFPRNVIVTIDGQFLIRILDAQWEMSLGLICLALAFENCLNLNINQLTLELSQVHSWIPK